MPAVKKGKSKKVNISRMSEAQAWNVVKHDVIHPIDLFKKAACAAGCSHYQQCIAMLAAMANTFVHELEYKSAFFLPGFGTFQKKFTPAQSGKMAFSWGKWRARRPQPAKTEIIFIPFGVITDVLGESSARNYRPPKEEGRSSTQPGAASSSSAAGSAGPQPADQHSPAPRDIVSADKDDDVGSSVMGSFSDDENDQPPAPALSGPN